MADFQEVSVGRREGLVEFLSHLYLLKVCGDKGGFQGLVEACLGSLGRLLFVMA